MNPDAEFLAIQEDIEYRFQPTNDLAKAISEKLCLTLYKERHCEDFINRAQSIPTHKVDSLPAEQRVAFQTRLSSMRENLRTLRRTARNYSISLSTANLPTPPDAIE